MEKLNQDSGYMANPCLPCAYTIALHAVLKANATRKPS